MKTYLLAGLAFLLVLLVPPWISARADLPSFDGKIVGTGSYVTPAVCDRDHGGGYVVKLCAHGVTRAWWWRDATPPFVGGDESALTRGTEWVRVTHATTGPPKAPYRMKILVENATNGRFESAGFGCGRAVNPCRPQAGRAATLRGFDWHYLLLPTCTKLYTIVTAVASVWSTPSAPLIQIQLELSMVTEVCAYGG
jgi:hypothetical protein